MFRAAAQGLGQPQHGICSSCTRSFLASSLRLVGAGKRTHSPPSVPRTYATRKLVPNPKRRQPFPVDSAPSPPQSAPQSDTGRVLSPSHPPLECPPLEFFAAECRRGNLREVPPEVYWRTCSLYVEASSSGKPGWEAEFVKSSFQSSPGGLQRLTSATAENDVSPALLHKLAAILSRTGSVGSAPALCRSLWLSASALGHVPATLTLMRFLSGRGEGKIPDAFRPVRTRFREIVSAGRNADATTLSGVFLAQEGRDAEAMASFRQAETMGEQQTQSFEWAVDCFLGMGKLLMKQGKLDEAHEYFQRVVSPPPDGLGNAQGYLGLAASVGSDDLERKYDYLLTASFNGLRESWMPLLEMEMQRLDKVAGQQDNEAIAEHERWATEWSALAAPLK
jgi:hypothetical protein